jgi:hypothetical protein
MLVLKMKLEFIVYDFGMTSRSMMYIPSFLTTVTSCQAMLSLCLSNLRVRNVGIKDERSFIVYAFRLTSRGMIYIPSFQKDCYRRSSNANVLRK